MRKLTPEQVVRQLTNGHKELIATILFICSLVLAISAAILIANGLGPEVNIGTLALGIACFIFSTVLTIISLRLSPLV